MSTQSPPPKPRRGLGLSLAHKVREVLDAVLEWIPSWEEDAENSYRGAKAIGWDRRNPTPGGGTGALRRGMGCGIGACQARASSGLRLTE